jgi:hypothetical protein
MKNCWLNLRWFSVALFTLVFWVCQSSIVDGCRKGTPPPPKTDAPLHDPVPSISLSRVQFNTRALTLNGTVSNINPRTHYIVAYAFVEQSGWWSVSPLSELRSFIAADGTWSCPVHAADTLARASRIQFFVLPDSVVPPYLTGAKALPAFLYSESRARKHITRED